jgi:alkylated DNA repair protein alkB family protein 6
MRVIVRHTKIPPNRWTQLTKRRLQAHPSTLTANNTLISAPLPPWLTTSPAILDRFSGLGVFRSTKHAAPNHVLVNEYRPGEGIMPHEDGPAYEPVVATVSLAGTVVLDLYPKDDGSQTTSNGSAPTPTPTPSPAFRILQEPGSLLVTTGDAYVAFLHGIAAVDADQDLGPATVANWDLLGDKHKFQSGVNQRTTRVSLTYRDVIKVSKLGIGILGRGKP